MNKSICQSYTCQKVFYDPQKGLCTSPVIQASNQPTYHYQDVVAVVLSLEMARAPISTISDYVLVSTQCSHVTAISYQDKQ